MKAIIAVPATLALIYRAYSKKSLTPAGLVAATLTAVAHAVHPWNLPFVLLVVFFLAGTRVTNIKKDVKAHLTVSSQGSSGGEAPRTHIQVFANSLVASILSLLHAYQLSQRKQALASGAPVSGSMCFAWGGDVLVVGIVAQYACVAADTFSSELGILSPETPRLITSWRLRPVARGTNGAVTVFGLLAGLLGSVLVVTAAVLFLPLCAGWTPAQKRQLMLGLAGWGALGSLVDSLLGGLFQRSVRDVRSGKIVEGPGGERVLVATSPSSPAPEHASGRAAVKAALLSGEGRRAVAHPDAAVAVADDENDDHHDKPAGRDPYDAADKHRRPSFGDEQPSRAVESGWDVLDNNDVNFLMAVTMSVGAMAIAARAWGLSPQDLLKP